MKTAPKVKHQPMKMITPRNHKKFVGARVWMKGLMPYRCDGIPAPTFVFLGYEKGKALIGYINDEFDRYHTIFTTKISNLFYYEHQLNYKALL